MPQRALGIVVGMAAVVALAVALLALGPAEDGPLTPDRYREELGAALGDVDLAADPRDPRALRETTGEFTELVGELTDFVPPPEVAATHARFVSGLNDYARMLERLSDAGPAGVIELQTRLAELGGLPGFDWVQALNELAAQGYVTAGLVRPSEHRLEPAGLDDGLEVALVLCREHRFQQTGEAVVQIVPAQR